MSICVVLFVICVVLLLNVMFYVLFMCKCVLPPGVNHIAVDKYINICLNVEFNESVCVKFYTTWNPSWALKMSSFVCLTSCTAGLHSYLCGAGTFAMRLT
jgi:hypothetical protein